jgi:hypothetical protein
MGDGEAQEVPVLVGENPARSPRGLVPINRAPTRKEVVTRVVTAEMVDPAGLAVRVGLVVAAGAATVARRLASPWWGIRQPRLTTTGSTRDNQARLVLKARAAKTPPTNAQARTA